MTNSWEKNSSEQKFISSYQLAFRNVTLKLVFQSADSKVNRRFARLNTKHENYTLDGKLVSEAVKVVSPILKDFLKLKQVEHFQGENYSATWKVSNQTLTLSDSSGSTKLEAQYVGGEWQAKVDNLTPQDVDFFQKLHPKIQEKLNPNPSIEEKRQLLRQEYEGLRERVRSNSNFQQAGVEEVDVGVAMLVIKESVKNGRTDNLINRVGEVLSQSDRLKEWKQSLPEGEYRASAKDYVVQKFEQASQIRESLLAEKQDIFDLAR